MMYMGDDFSRDTELNGLSPDQELVLDLMANELEAERAEMLDSDAEIQMIENMIESGTLQPQDL